MIFLQTLGTLDLKDSNGSAFRSVLAQPRRVALLVHLAVAAPHGYQRRDRLLALFWPEYDAEHARASLNRAIYFLRRELGSEIVLSRGHEEIGLNRDRVWCDAAAFEAAIDKGQTRDALELYRGDLLLGFFASNARGFEEWLEVERMRLRERAAQCAWALATGEEAKGNFALAAHWARRGVEFAPFREAGVRRLLDLLDRTGDRASAAHVYRKFADALAEEFELAPAPETRELIDAIRARESRRAEANLSDTVLPDATPVEVNAPASPADVRVPGPAFAKRRLMSRRIAAIAVIGLAVGMVGLSAHKDGPIDSRRIDVTTFDNRTGDHALDRVSRSAAERIGAGLRSAALLPMVAVVEPGSLRSGLRTIRGALPGSQRTRPAIVVSGVIKRQRDGIVVQAWITDTRLDRGAWAVAPIAIVVSSSDDAIDQIKNRVLGGIALIKRFGTGIPLIASPPPTYEAFLEFTEGLRFESHGEFARARDQFRAAVMRDSSFTWPLLHAARTGAGRPGAGAWTDSMLATLNHVRERLPTLQRHLVDYLQAMRAEDWPASHRAIRQAAELAPQNYGYLYATSTTFLNRPRETVQALSMGGLDTLMRNHPESYWRVMTSAYHQLGEHRNELAAARRARATKPESVTALMEEITALVALGRSEAVRARVDTLFWLPREQWQTPAWAAQVVARELRAHGQLEAAGEVLLRAHDWFQARPVEEAATQAHREQIATVLYLMGRLDQADSLFRRLAADAPDDPNYTGFLGTIAARRGQRAEAEAMAAKLEAMPGFAPVPGEGTLVWRAMIAALLGDRERAVSLLTDAFGPTGSFYVHDQIEFEELRDYAPFRDFIRPKG